MSLNNARFNLFVNEVINRLVDVSIAVKSGDTFTRNGQSQYLQGLIWGAQLGGMITAHQWESLSNLILVITYPENGEPVKVSLIGGIVESVLPELPQ